MRPIRTSIVFTAAMLAAVGTSLCQWSMLDEVTVLRPSLTASMVWEQDFSAVCGVSQESLLSLSCSEISPQSNVDWIGYDAIGDRYGVFWRGVAGGFNWEIQRRRRGTVNDEVIATIVERRYGQSYTDKQIHAARSWSIDLTNGELLLEVNGYCEESLCGSRIHRVGTIRISGLPSLYDIELSYQPPSTLSFNVPVRPEGLVGADSFSVYAGDVRMTSDLSQATPLKCTVPAGRPPVPGEHLSVADPLPNPAPGDARYYVAAVNYQGQRRAGRTSMNGVLQGRDAAALHGCP